MRTRPLRRATAAFVAACALGAGCLDRGLARAGEAARPAGPAKPASTNDPRGVPVILQTSHARLVVKPEIGRIVEFGRISEAGQGPNMLWVNPEQKSNPRSRTSEWANWGGDKVWCSWQSAWPQVMGRGWPPDEVFDGGRFDVLESSARGVIMASGASPYLRARLTRRIELAPDEPRVTIRNVLARVGDSPHPLHIWSVTQVPPAEFYLLGMKPFTPGARPPWVGIAERPEEVERFLSLAGRSARFDPPRDRATKVGALGEWVAGVYERDVFLQVAAFEPDGEYPDKSSVQVYADKSYAELETLSPQRRLAPGDSMTNTVEWILVERRAGETPEGLAERLARIARARR